ncbi:MAG: leucine--tRNA ligase [Patescibacteria group bacterium]|nr:leucine--tRNA ligase [Patescibacteria group bacterium]
MKYDFKKIEAKWQKKWEEEKLYQVDVKNSAKPFYNLMMFPYPSAEGLHVGNMYAFTGSDIYGRYQRLKGNDVFEPIGLDGFGIHSENFAIKNKIHPAEMAEKTQNNFYKQLHMIGNSYDWSKTLETYDPDYYKWTQWLFLQMYKKGLAYKKKAAVNWCPSCMTVLSDEQVEAGLCERCKTEVVKKDMSQWFFKITDYAEKLLKNIDKIDWTEKTKVAQKNWIGKSEGAEINFQVPMTNDQSNPKSQITNLTVFTTRPDTLFGCTYLVLSPEHKFIEENKEKIENWNEVEEYIKKAKEKTDQERTNEKTGVELKGIKAVNRANKKEIPIFVADYVLSGYGTGAIMAVPAHDERDFEFAQKYDLEIVEVVEPEKKVKIAEQKCYTGDGILINSGKFDGMKNVEAKKAITEFVGGKFKINYKLRDWCISRQRFWGPPIPIAYCEKCGTVPVPEKDLPVLLPKTDDYMPDGTDRSPLARNEKFVETKCPKCGGDAKRETDVSDTFLDSSWYFLRYPSVDIKDQPFDKEITKKWLPVDMYIGGHEHAVLHLLYTRFVTMVLYDLGMVDFEEPFKKFRAHGLIIKDGAKMSKSKGNVINPDDYIEKYGADVLRTYLMFIGPLKQGGDFRDEGVVGIERFFGRLFFLVSKTLNSLGNEKHFEIERNKLIKKATNDIENLDYNTIIASLMEFLNLLDKQKEKISKKDLETLIIILSPLAPHFCEEMWEMLGNKESVFKVTWPEFDENKTKEAKIKLIIQVNGKVRDFMEVNNDISEEKASELVQKREKIMKFIAGKKIKKIIFVKGRLINIVI